MRKLIKHGGNGSIRERQSWLGSSFVFKCRKKNLKGHGHIFSPYHRVILALTWLTGNMKMMNFTKWKLGLLEKQLFVTLLFFVVV